MQFCSRKPSILDAYCKVLNADRPHSILASAAHIVVLAYFHIFGGVNNEPFTPVEHSASNTIQEPYSVTNKVWALPLAIQRFAQDEAHG